MAKKYEDVAQYLLESGYMLTALEFYQELLEDGNDLEVLKKQFGSAPQQQPTAEELPRTEGKPVSQIHFQIEFRLFPQSRMLFFERKRSS
jgi:hypothetical protein